MHKPSLSSTSAPSYNTSPRRRLQPAPQSQPSQQNTDNASQLASQPVSQEPSATPELWPWPHQQLQPHELRSGPVQQVYFVTYTSVRQQMLDEEVRSSLAQLHRRGVD